MSDNGQQSDSNEDKDKDIDLVETFFHLMVENVVETGRSNNTSLGVTMAAVLVMGIHVQITAPAMAAKIVEYTACGEHQHSDMVERLIELANKAVANE